MLSWAEPCAQDIDSQIKQPKPYAKEPRNYKSHEINIIEKDCLIYKILGQKRLKVNSFHHQSVNPATNFKITAIALTVLLKL